MAIRKKDEKKHELHISIDKTVYEYLIYWNKNTGKTMTKIIEEALGRYYLYLKKVKELEKEVPDDDIEAI